MFPPAAASHASAAATRQIQAEMVEGEVVSWGRGSWWLVGGEGGEADEGGAVLPGAAAAGRVAVPVETLLVQYSTVQYITLQYSTVQYSTGHLVWCGCGTRPRPR